MSQQSTVGGFFVDPNSPASKRVTLAAAQLVAPVVRGAALAPVELMTGGGARVSMFVLDASPSMAELGGELRDCFNTEFVPAVRDARSGDVSALRVGGLAFSSRSSQIWQNAKGEFFHPFDQLPPLTQTEYSPETGAWTALYDAIDEGMTLALGYADVLQKQHSVNVDVDLIVFSDGADNQSRKRAEDIKALLAARKKQRVRAAFFYFETSLGLSNPREFAIKELGFDGEMVRTFLAVPGESLEDRKRRFRQMMAVMSRTSAAKNTTAAAAAAAIGLPEEDDVV